jgi:hypothetical protein
VLNSPIWIDQSTSVEAGETGPIHNSPSAFLILSIALLIGFPRGEYQPADPPFAMSSDWPQTAPDFDEPGDLAG